ncbi:MAG: hypothetical protein PHX61_00385 [Alphaproteobacteria bacterium]|nr:hypothetical protein [Alphaproteobacteria bacterium]
MDVLGTIRSIFIDEYKFGVEKQSSKPVVYVDVDNIDQYTNKPALERLVETVKEIKNKVSLKNGQLDFDDENEMNKIPQELREKLEKGMAEAADIVRPQLEEFHPGLTVTVSNSQLTRLLVASLSQGPFSDRSLFKDNGICVINGPNGNEIDPDHLIKDGIFGFAKGENGKSAFNPEHLRPLPGDKKLWDQLVGEHEGEHCNQPEKTGQTEAERDLQTLDGEIKSDRAALKSLRDAGHLDVAQAWVDIRIISTADGDNTHASSLFIEDGVDYTGVTQNNLDAAQDLKQEMTIAVQKASGLDALQTEQLRKKDPQRYANYLEEQIKTGDFPTEHRMYDAEIENKIIERMGITQNDYYDLPTSKLPELFETYKNLEKENGFQTRGDNPELLRKMAEQYVGATRRLFIEDTTPKNPPAPTAGKHHQEEVEETLDERLQRNAEFDVYPSIDRNIAKRLGITESEVEDLYEKNPDRYMKIAEDMIKDGSFDTKTEILSTQKEIDTKISKLFGVERENMNEIPYSIRNRAERYLEERGETAHTFNNPYLIEAVKKEIKDYKAESSPQVTGCSNKAFAENAAECTTQKSTTLPSQEQVSSLYMQTQTKIGLTATV